MMNRLSAHIGYLYTELPLADRLAAAAHDGFTAVEHPEPHEMPAAEMRLRLDDLGLTFTQISSGMGDPTEKGLAALPGREGAFRDGCARAADYALAVGCAFLHPMAGIPAPGAEPRDIRAVYAENIAWALDHCTRSGLRLLVEAITIPGYAMNSLDDAMALQDTFGGRLSLLFDSYHAANLGIDPVDWVAAHAGRIGHVHIADHPGRHEPGTGRLDFPRLLSALSRAGYDGAIGFEYIPSGATRDSTRFLPEWKRHLASTALTGAAS